MPPRWLCVLIILFWLGTTAWLFWSEILPDFLLDQPPPYTIDLVDEAQTTRAQVRWDVFVEGQEKVWRSFQGRTWVEYREEPDDSFTLQTEIRSGNRADRLDLGTLKLISMHSLYRVSRSGRLLAVQADMSFDARIAGVPLTGFAVHMEGEVRDGRFFPLYRFRLPDGSDKEWQEPPVEVSRHGSVLVPLHPVSRIRGLRPGQEWRMPLVNPFADALAAGRFLGGSSGPQLVTARVLAETRPLPGHPDIDCLIIHYEEDETSHLTWVQADTGLVMRQEGSILGTRLIMQRETVKLEP